MRALRAVPAGTPDRQRAERLLSRISDARRIALNSSLPEQVDYLPTRLQGATPAQPPRTDFTKARPIQTAPSTATNTNDAATNSAEAQGALKITMYSTSWCGYCRKARSWFQDNGFAFIEKDIEKDSEAAREYQAASGGYGGVPLIVVNGKSFRGFDQRALLARIRAVLGS
jgi:glutaredoxin